MAVRESRRLATTKVARVETPRLWPGHPYPLGATYDGEGTNFSVFSEVAERVELCLFDREGRHACLPLPEVSGYCWHGYVPSVRPGQRYGYRVHGPSAPGDGQRGNPAKLLLDPYAKAVEGQLQWDEAVFGHAFDHPDGPPTGTDSAPYVPKAVVVDPAFDWHGDRRPNTPLHDTVIYELHVKGFTVGHPDIPSCAAPMLAWPTRWRSSTCSGSASPP